MLLILKYSGNGIDSSPPNTINCSIVFPLSSAIKKLMFHIGLLLGLRSQKIFPSGQYDTIWLRIQINFFYMQPWYHLRFRRLAVGGFLLEFFADAALRIIILSTVRTSSTSFIPCLCINPPAMSHIGTAGVEHQWGCQGPHQK